LSQRDRQAWLLLLPSTITATLFTARNGQNYASLSAQQKEEAHPRYLWLAKIDSWLKWRVAKNGRLVERAVGETVAKNGQLAEIACRIAL
jgi:hypothetical protein